MIDSAQLSSDSPIPLYEQLKSRLVAGIRAARWSPVDPLPSERNLMREFGVSRATVRRAIDDLEHDGWVVRRHGHGTFVLPVETEAPSSRPLGFSAAMLRDRRTPSSILLSAALEDPDEAVARHLDLAPGLVVAAITRVRLADGEPLMVERSHIPYALAPRLLERDLGGSLHRLLIEHYRLDLRSCDETLEVTRPEGWVAKALGIKKKRPIFSSARIIRDGDDRGIEFTRRYVRTDLCGFRAHLAGTGEGGADFVVKEQGGSNGR